MADEEHAQPPQPSFLIEFLKILLIIVLFPFIILFKMFNHTKKNPSWYHKFVFGELKIGGQEWSINGWNISRGLVLGITFFGLILAFAAVTPHFFVFAVTWIVGLAPIWLPLTLAVVAMFVWVHYVRELYISAQGFILLEIKIPREITKSPRAMEMVLTSLYHAGSETTYGARFWRGSVRTWFSLEMVSIGGNIHFYVWGAGRFRSLIEAAFYAQFPEIEIHEVEDYAKKFEYNSEYHRLYYIEYQYNRPDSSAHHYKDTYQLKSYIDFELDKDPKEEFKVDPLAQVLELMGTTKSHEQMWIQIMIRAEAAEGALIRTGRNWPAQIDEEIRQIKIESMVNPKYPDDNTKESSTARLTTEQQDRMKHLERHKSKTHFQTSIRGVFFGDERYGQFNGQLISSFREIYRVFDSAHLNKLRPTNGLDFDYPWQDIGGRVKIERSRRFFDAYQRRSSFYPPWEIDNRIMTTEALATIFHFPSSSIKTPGIQRIAAKKAEPPINLPM
ncbi:MAG: hypothetical protein JWO50_855 [Candidatus Kaiserbacteria bacterium]|nr:hypothetical protein [Candidatus Kaiserbacteria bacterium]